MKNILSVPAAVLFLLIATNLQALDIPALNQLLPSDARFEEDRARDPIRKPAEVLNFLGLEPGMTVMDYIAADGYYTAVLSLAVGPAGKVYSHNSTGNMEFDTTLAGRDMKVRQAVQVRSERLPYANVEPWEHGTIDLQMAPDSLDFVITALNFHDIYNMDPARAETALRGLWTILKPGGILGIIDHAGDAGRDNNTLHRATLQSVLDTATASGFVVEATSDLLHNAADDHSLAVFDPSLGRNTDRFIVRLRKP